MTELTYPVRLVVSRPPTKATPFVSVTLDSKELHDAAELGGRLTLYESWARAYRTTGLYTYTPAPAAEAEATAAAIRAELEQKHGLTQKDGAESAANTSAPEAPERTPDQGQDTTKPAPRQVELVIVYETDEARERPRLHNGGELVSLKVDGKEAKPPTQDLSRLYRLLQERGYTPAGFQWLGQAVGGRRQRRQVYTQA